MTASQVDGTTAARSRRAAWAGYGAAAWGFLFALPSFYWALGGTAGATTTISPSLVRLVQDGVTWFIVVLWVTGALKVVGGVLGLALVRRWGTGMSRLLQFAAWGAGVLLLWHGGLFVVQGLLLQLDGTGIAPELLPVIRWYTYLWGPWFMAGGLLFVLAARVQRRGLADRRGTAVAGAAGGVGALGLSVALTVMGIG
ncbi:MULTISPECIES: DUF3995 domain-containing protein [Streptosporangium]|uniref:DUF3995 domain-containing protein n=1 Tax=Streptosporangium brasiliense TaxID=47480 RepID=A0ABT9R1N9_9ACTN|nr:DUF3995 domain-containing protein [Streptosporangium brasiliense]MDP9863142.1 hypothetical protein [Streptosporangium brasiliense]